MLTAAMSGIDGFRVHGGHRRKRSRLFAKPWCGASAWLRASNSTRRRMPTAEPLISRRGLALLATSFRTDEELMIATPHAARACDAGLSSSSGRNEHDRRRPRLTLLKGKKALVTGIANDQSIAWGCAKAFHAFGADVAVTYLNDKSKPYVEPLAKRDRGADLHAVGSSARRPVGGRIRKDRDDVGQARSVPCIRSPLHRNRICKAVSSTARKTGSCLPWRSRAGRSSEWPSWPSRS